MASSSLQGAAVAPPPPPGTEAEEKLPIHPLKKKIHTQGSCLDTVKIYIVQNVNRGTC